MSPDWSAKEEPVPYAKLDDPQSLNLYAYVRNNPLSRVDADGHDGPGLLGAVEAGLDEAEAFAQGVWAEGIASGWLPAAGAGGVSIGGAATGGIGVIGGAMLFPKDLDPGGNSLPLSRRLIRHSKRHRHLRQITQRTRGLVRRISIRLDSLARTKIEVEKKEMSVDGHHVSVQMDGRGPGHHRLLHRRHRHRQLHHRLPSQTQRSSEVSNAIREKIGPEE